MRSSASATVTMSIGSRRSKSSSDRRVDPAVGLAVEVGRAQELGDLDDGVAVDQDRAEHGLLGLETLGRQAVDHARQDSNGGWGRHSRVADRSDRSTKR